jgi:hypothetical protein
MAGSVRESIESVTEDDSSGNKWQGKSLRTQVFKGQIQFFELFWVLFLSDAKALRVEKNVVLSYITNTCLAFIIQRFCSSSTTRFVFRTLAKSWLNSFTVLLSSIIQLDRRHCALLGTYNLYQISMFRSSASIQWQSMSPYNLWEHKVLSPSSENWNYQCLLHLNLVRLNQHGAPLLWQVGPTWGKRTLWLGPCTT